MTRFAEFAAGFRGEVERSADALLAMSDAEAARRPAPGKWSRKEIVGHLVDSATNNHARFVRAQIEEDLVFPGYDQDAWVTAQGYSERPWKDLVELWRAQNLHIAHVMSATPENALTRPRRRHNLHEIAWQPFPANEPATLEWFLRDYVGHMRHHLAQAGVRQSCAG